MTIMVEAEVNQDKDDSSAPPYRDQSRYHPYRGLGSTSQSADEQCAVGVAIDSAGL